MKGFLAVSLLLVVASGCSMEERRTGEEHIFPGAVAVVVDPGDGAWEVTLLDEHRVKVLLIAKWNPTKWYFQYTFPSGITGKIPRLTLPADTTDFANVVYEFHTNAMINIKARMRGEVAFDDPGCDNYPDTVCTTQCCATHDVCFELNDCNAWSWLPFVGSEECDNCNSDVAGCLGSALNGCDCEMQACGCDMHTCFDDDTGAYWCAQSCN